MLLPQHVAGATQNVTLEMRPHCTFEEMEGEFGGTVPDVEGTTSPNENTCYPFETEDPKTKRTRVLEQGDTLDMDLILRNPTGQDISRFRAWLAYDPTMLVGEEIEIDESFELPTPGEADFSEDDGWAKIGASTADPISAKMIVLARVKFTVLEASEPRTIISFYDPQSGADSHTQVLVGDPGENVLEPALGSLLVRLNTETSVDPDDWTGAEDDTDAGASEDSVSSEDSLPPMVASSVAASSMPAFELPSLPAATPPPTSSLFSQLQVQNLRATTEGTSIYLAWDALNSAELAGYNVYYGTVSGQYIQRRSVDKGSTTLTLRNLPLGRTYFIAVRGMSTSGAESDFSREVGIVVGNPATSTSPLASIVNQGPQGTPPRTGGSLAGNTGVPSGLALLLIASAIVGTALAFKRQMTAYTPRA